MLPSRPAWNEAVNIHSRPAIVGGAEERGLHY